jgi:hypothetical protein
VTVPQVVEQPESFIYVGPVEPDVDLSVSFVEGQVEEDTVDRIQLLACLGRQEMCDVLPYFGRQIRSIATSCGHVSGKERYEVLTQAWRLL